MIGLFDSGSGGLTVLTAIRERLPSSDIVYFGDIAHVPYGSKTPEELLGLVVHGLGLLQKEGATKIVSACNSVSASMALSLFDATGLQVLDMIEMVGPTVSYFKGASLKIALCATPATIRSGIYQMGFKLSGHDIGAFAVPELAAAIEFGAPREEIKKIISAALTPDMLAPYDVLLLACTHYPLVIDVFAELFPDLALFDPAVAVAERAQQRFWPQEVGNGTTRFLISKDSPEFRALVARLLPNKNYTIDVV
ncbi:MAG TPA: aspartate/glutamate racemase family protein [Candidatus Paceibacterota bacterium]|nr:aspartate/glutamate racemase family protein [Candidatus Paceibacterota bacterium]